MAREPSHRPNKQSNSLLLRKRELNGSKRSHTFRIRRMMPLMLSKDWRKGLNFFFARMRSSKMILKLIGNYTRLPVLGRILELVPPLISILTWSERV